MGKKHLHRNHTIPFIVFGGFLVALLIIFLVSRFIYPSLFSPCANSISCIHDLSGNLHPKQNKGEFMGRPVVVPQMLFNTLKQKEPVLGMTTSGEKQIFVDLSSQRLFAFEGNTLIYDFVVSTGLFNQTPTGKFYIWVKLLATNMEGGNRLNGTYYNLPNVPYTMYFYNQYVGKWEGYGIHGDYWDKAFGYPATFGCIGLSIDDAKRLYYWTDPFPQENTTLASITNPGTPIIIFGQTPHE